MNETSSLLRRKEEEGVNVPLDKGVYALELDLEVLEVFEGGKMRRAVVCESPWSSSNPNPSTPPTPSSSSLSHKEVRGSFDRWDGNKKEKKKWRRVMPGL